MSEEYDVVPQSDWASHESLSQLDCASDLDGDAAYFVTDSDTADASALQNLQLQYSYDGKRWETVAATTGGFFPSRGWAKAVLTWYWPPFDHPLLELGPGLESSIRWRALLPRQHVDQANDASEK